jgi:hypothetical protein
MSAKTARVWVDHATESIARAIASRRFRFAHERELQDGIARALSDESIVFTREARLGDAGCIDFLCEGGVGLEVKVGGPLAAVTRQMHRYACCDDVRALLLVTSRRTLDRLPDAMMSKPVRVVHLIESAL